MSTAVHITLGEFIARPEREDDQREELIEGVVVSCRLPRNTGMQGRWINCASDSLH